MQPCDSRDVVNSDDQALIWVAVWWLLPADSVANIVLVAVTVIEGSHEGWLITLCSGAGAKTQPRSGPL